MKITLRRNRNPARYGLTTLDVWVIAETDTHRLCATPSAPTHRDHTHPSTRMTIIELAKLEWIPLEPEYEDSKETP